MTRYLTLAEYLWLAEQVTGTEAETLVKASRTEVAGSALRPFTPLVCSHCRGLGQLRRDTYPLRVLHPVPGRRIKRWGPRAGHR